MAKSGINTSILVDGYDVSNYFKSADVESSLPTLDATAFQDTAKVYLPSGFLEGVFQLEGFYRSDPVNLDQVTDLLRARLGSATQQVVLISPEGAGTLSNPCFPMKGNFNNLQVSSPAENVIMSNTAFQSCAGVPNGLVLHALGAETATGNGSSVDNAAASANGGVGQLQITAKSGTTPTLDVVIQHSTNNSTWVDLITFTQANAIGAQQIEVTGTVNRYVRAIYTLGGSGPSFTFAVAFARR